MPLRRKPRPYRSPEEIALHNAEEALRAEPEGGPWQRYLTTATATAICAAAVAAGGILLADDDSASGVPSGISFHLGSGDARISSSTFLDERRRVCTTIKDPSGEPIPLAAGTRCTRLSPLAFRLDSDPAFVTGVAVEGRSLVLFGYTQTSIGKIFFRRPESKRTRVASAWRPETSQYPGLALKPFLIKIDLREPSGDPSLHRQVRDYVPNIFCTIADDTTRVTVHPNLMKAPVAPAET
jgi:hypothetical protein